jgi:hypothetical protein
MDNLYSTVVIVIISIYFVFLIILPVAGILVPNSDLKQRINTIFIQVTQLLTWSMVLKAYYKFKWETGIPETKYLSVGLVGETSMYKLDQKCYVCKTKPAFKNIGLEHFY